VIACAECSSRYNLGLRNIRMHAARDWQRVKTFRKHAVLNIYGSRAHNATRECRARRISHYSSRETRDRRLKRPGQFFQIQASRWQTSYLLRVRVNWYECGPASESQEHEELSVKKDLSNRPSRSCIFRQSVKKHYTAERFSAREMAQVKVLTAWLRPREEISRGTSVGELAGLYFITLRGCSRFFKRSVIRSGGAARVSGALT